MINFRTALVLALFLSAAGCTEAPEPVSALQQSPSDLVAGEVMAMAYSGFREGQHPDRG